MIRPRPLVLCGPSGVGKSSLLKELLSEFKDIFGFSISHTSRNPREGEQNGREYHFVTREVMGDMIKRGDFIESAEYSANLYGTSKKAVEDLQIKGKICILDIEIQGVKQIKMTSLDPLLVFVKPPSLLDLENRLKKRGTETEESLKRRLDVAQIEIAYGEEEGNFDLIVVNDDLDEAYKKLRNFLYPHICQLRNCLEGNNQYGGGGGDM